MWPSSILPCCLLCFLTDVLSVAWVQYLEIVQQEEEEQAEARAAAEAAARAQHSSNPSTSSSTSSSGDERKSSGVTSGHAKPQKRLQLGYRCAIGCPASGQGHLLHIPKRPVYALSCTLHSFDAIYEGK